MHVPTDAAALSFTIATKLAMSVQLPATIRQGWLDCESVHDRFLQLGALGDNVSTLLEEEIVKSSTDDRYLN